MPRQVEVEVGEDLGLPGFESVDRRDLEIVLQPHLQGARIPGPWVGLLQSLQAGDVAEIARERTDQGPESGYVCADSVRCYVVHAESWREYTRKRISHDIFIPPSSLRGGLPGCFRFKAINVYYIRLVIVTERIGEFFSSTLFFVCLS